MRLILNVWTNIKDGEKAAATLSKLLEGVNLNETKSEIYWKDETKRVVTFERVMDGAKSGVPEVLEVLNRISHNWTLNTDGLCQLQIEVNGHSNDSFTHSSISFATVTTA